MNAQNEMGQSPLHSLADGRHKTHDPELLGMNIEIIQVKCENCAEIARVSVAAVADLTLRNKQGQTALELAIQENHAAVVEVLSAVPQ